MRASEVPPEAPVPGAPVGVADSGRSATDLAATPERIGGYAVLREIGRGGMARVYRVREESSGKELALKQLLKGQSSERERHAAALFEREFHTLVQLSHPRVIEVYDYGVAEAGPYYTMELLDGGDLRARAPLPWREACALLYDVCSSLALLHSRRLVHRDITPRNVHCTTTGHAKLIDFGAMAPMGPSGQVVGTPAFVAPEVVHRSALDGRTDLYSLGATLYYAITGRMPYPARDLASVLKAWLTPATPPSILVPDVPPALDALMMSLISLEPALRPRGAFEVMQRLAALAGIEHAEPVSVSQAYLNTPSMIGRDDALQAFRRPFQRALRGRGGGVLVQAEGGLGRSRLLDAFALEAKLLGAVALRAGASQAQAQPLAVARTLAEQLNEALPDAAYEAARNLGLVGPLFDAPAPERRVAPGASMAPRTARLVLRPIDGASAAQIEAQKKLADWMLRVARRHALLFAIDDVDRIDEPSIAVLAAIAHRARRARVLLALTSATASARASGALDVLSGHCAPLGLRPLESSETEALLLSVFGDVPNLALLAHRLHAASEGRPRECMALAQLLVDRGVISYAGGTWTLPEQLSSGDLPRHATDVFRTRVAQLGARSKCLARAQALAIDDAFTRQDYALLMPEAERGAIDEPISELLRNQIVSSDGDIFRLSHEALREALRADLDADERKRLHLLLADACDPGGHPAIHAALYLFEADQPDRGLDRLLEMLSGAVDSSDLEQRARMPYLTTAALIERGLNAAEALGRPVRDQAELRRWLSQLSVVAEDRMHHRAAPELLALIERDSGLSEYRKIEGEPDPMQRLMRALTRTQELAAQLPESERGYSIQDAIKHLVYYVVVSIAVGARTYDTRLLASLPELLEPFAALSPAVHAMWQNALATLEINQRKFDRALERYRALYEKLENLTDAELPRVHLIRSAIAYALGVVSAQLGLESTGRWVEVLDKDPLQQVNAMYLRKVVCLQRGDFDNAERFRRKAEVLAIQASSRQMFNTTMTIELGIHALARDLTGVKQVMDRIEPLTGESHVWRAYHQLANAHFHRLRGDLPAAFAACERALELSAPHDGDPLRCIVAWPTVAAAYVELLVELDRANDARAFGERALDQCARLEIESGAFDLMRALALAEGKSGRLVQAADRLDLLLAAQRKLGAVGLNLGASYEARARIGIWQGDHAAVEHYGRLAALEYRHGRSSPLGTRYERLLQEARVAGIHALPQLASLDQSPLGTTTLGGRRPTIETSITEAMSGADSPRARAELALSMLCEVHAARGGHLYVMRDGALKLAASLGADPPDDDLQAVLDEFWQLLLNAPDMPTTFAPGGQLPPASSTTLLTDADGTAFQPIALQCVVDGTALLAGVAALLPGQARQARSDAVHIAALVGSYLVRAGDVHALPC